MFAPQVLRTRLAFAERQRRTDFLLLWEVRFVFKPLIPSWDLLAEGSERERTRIVRTFCDMGWAWDSHRIRKRLRRVRELARRLAQGTLSARDRGTAWELVSVERRWGRV